MVIDTIAGFVWSPSRMFEAIPIMNIDLFCITALFALSFQVRRYQ